MNCGPVTVVKYAKKLSADDKINSRMIVRENNMGTSGNNIDYKDEMLNFIKLNPSLSKTEIRNLMGKQYGWLYKYDKEWFMENMPDNIAKSEIDNKSTNRVDWNARDEQICNALKTEYEKIISSDKPIRVSKTLLGERTGYRRLILNYLDKLPKTNHLLKEMCEDIESFQKRRIKFAAKQLHDKQGSFIRWELMIDASIKKPSEIKLDTFINDIMNEY